jgi:hypothetical protein
MSLAKAFRQYLVGVPGFSAKIPGGIFAEIAPASAASTTFGVYSGVEIVDQFDLAGRSIYKVESFDLTVTAKTVAQCEEAFRWILDKSGPGSWSGVSEIKVFWWRVTTSGHVSEIVLDGSDESIRQVRMSLTGAFCFI